MNGFISWISQPWPWYIGGPLIGLMVPLLLIFLNKSFGISSSLRHVCAMCVPTNISYFKYDWKKDLWNIVFVLGVAGGAVLVYFGFPNPEPVDITPATTAKLAAMGVTDFSGLIPQDVFGWDQLNTPRTWIMVVLGGFLVGFGTRYAGGCTSGHAIMGMSLLSVGSLVATVGFFIGGLIVSWFILPHILAL